MNEPAAPERGVNDGPTPTDCDRPGNAPPAGAPGPPAPDRDTRAHALVADWVVTLFRPFPTAGDLDRLATAVAAALRSATQDAEARDSALAAAVEQVARRIHAERHAGLYVECAESPCPPLREAVRRAQSA